MQALPVARLTRVSSEVLAVRRAAAGQAGCAWSCPTGSIDADVACWRRATRRPGCRSRSRRATASSPSRGCRARSPASTSSADWRRRSSSLGHRPHHARPRRSRSPPTKPRRSIHAISRHGLLPRTHPGTPPAGRPAAVAAGHDPDHRAGAAGRPDVAGSLDHRREPGELAPASWTRSGHSCPGLWRRMPDEDKRLFLRHVARYWEVHRHLMPPATASRITRSARDRAAGWCTAGRSSAVTQHADRLRILADTGADDRPSSSADWLINGTGPTGDIDGERPARCSATCSRPGWRGPTRSGSASTPAPDGAVLEPGQASPATSCSRSGRRCAACGTRPRPSPRSASRPRRWPSGSSAAIALSQRPGSAA